jgi:DNA invertase Pin-like site-specific DNA recombinase
VAKHGFEYLLFWSLDRLTREGTFATLQNLRRLSDHGVKFKSYTDQYVDSLGVFGEAIIGILAAVAQQERIRLSERTKAGLARVRAKGVSAGTSCRKDGHSQGEELAGARPKPAFNRPKVGGESGACMPET